MAAIAAPATALLRAPVTSRAAGGRVHRAPLGGVVALPRSSSAVSLGRSRRSTVVRCVQ
jgi:hypothetical protein